MVFYVILCLLGWWCCKADKEGTVGPKEEEPNPCWENRCWR